MNQQNQQSSQKKVLPSEDISIFCGEIAMMLKGGISLSDGIGAVAEHMINKESQAMLLKMKEQMEQQETFSTALRNGGVFPDYMVHMVEIGEHAGTMEQVMDSLADYYEKDNLLKKQIKSAITYPVVTIVMMAIVVGVLAAKVFPVFTQIFETLGADMSGGALLAVNLGTVFVNTVLILVGLFVVILVFLALFARSKGGMIKLTAFFSGFFLTKKLFSKISAARFANVLSMLLGSGYHAEDALEMTEKVLPNPLVRERVALCKTKLGEGASFSDALKQTELFSGLQASMISVGTQAGSLDTVLQKISDTYMDEVDDSINRTVSVIEPIMVGLTSIIIGSILLSVMLPLMGILSSVG